MTLKSFTSYNLSRTRAHLATYLGVKISHDLRWNHHIDYVTAKANSLVRFVRRNININNPEIKERAYKTLVRPILEYSSTVWDRHTTTAVKRLSQCNEELLGQP